MLKSSSQFNKQNVTVFSENKQDLLTVAPPVSSARMIWLNVVQNKYMQHNCTCLSVHR